MTAREQTRRERIVKVLRVYDGAEFTADEVWEAIREVDALLTELEQAERQRDFVPASIRRTARALRRRVHGDGMTAVHSFAWLLVALGVTWLVLMLGIVAAIRQAAR